MIGYTTVGTNNFEKACAFYDKLFESMGAGRTMDFGEFIVWGTAPDQPGFSVTKPYDGKEATVGNGTMIALVAPNRKAVDKVYETAMANGASCEGKPGIRGDEKMGFYAGYFRDLDGNKLNAFCVGQE